MIETCPISGVTLGEGVALGYKLRDGAPETTGGGGPFGTFDWATELLSGEPVGSTICSPGRGSEGKGLGSSPAFKWEGLGGLWGI